MLDFIREKVIMANNPECKTYEEALEKEVKQLGSLVDCDMIARDYIIPERAILTVSASNKYRERFVIEPVYMKTFCVYGKRKEGDIYKNGTYYTDRILGLPITLERLLVTLQNQCVIILGERKEELFKISITRTLDRENKYEFTVALLSFNNWLIGESEPFTTTSTIIDFKWQPNQTLENQKEYTIKCIYDILNS